MRLLGIFFLVIGTCAFAPEGIEPMEAPAHYKRVFHEAVACTGHYRPYEDIRWSVMPGQDFKCGSGRCIGHWQSPNHITIAGAWVNIDWVVRHEIIHYLTRYTHDSGNGKIGPRDRELWGERCKAMWGFLGNDPNYKP